MSSFKDRAGQVWLGVQLEDEGDVCLVVASHEKRGMTYHTVVDLCTGELDRFAERDPQVWRDWESHPGRRRLA